MGTRLEQLTQKYWEVSSIYNCRLDKPMNVGEALTVLRKASRELGPKWSLRRKMESIKFAIIRGDKLSPKSQKQG